MIKLRQMCTKYTISLFSPKNQRFLEKNGLVSRIASDEGTLGMATSLIKEVCLSLFCLLGAAEKRPSSAFDLFGYDPKPFSRFDLLKKLLFFGDMSTFGSSCPKLTLTEIERRVFWGIAGSKAGILCRFDPNLQAQTDLGTIF